MITVAFIVYGIGAVGATLGMGRFIRWDETRRERAERAQ